MRRRVVIAVLVLVAVLAIGVAWGTTLTRAQIRADAWPGPLGWLYTNTVGNITASLICGAALGVWGWRKFVMCEQPRCWRIGRTEVHGTRYKTCEPHSTPEHHHALRAQHETRHPNSHAMIAENHCRTGQAHAEARTKETP